MASLWSRLRKLFAAPSSKALTSSSRRQNHRTARRFWAAGRFEQLESRALLTVTYQGGDLLEHVQAQPVFMGSDWASSSALVSQAASLNSYVGYLVNSTYMDMLTGAGYNVGRGAATDGATLNLSINKTVTLTDSQIHSNLQTAINASQVAAPSDERLYVVYVEPGVVVKLGASTSRTSFLGYHGAFAGHTADGQPADIRYAVMPYPGSPNPTPSSQGYASAFDQLTSVSSHEIAEAVTDPDVNYKTLGWYDFNKNGEIADLTRTTTRLNGYLVQNVVDKNDHVISPAPDTGGGTGGDPGGGTTSLAAPSITSISAASLTSAKITWTTVTGATGYRVLLTQNGQTSEAASFSATTTSATIPGLTPGSTVSFKVQAYNSTQTADSAAASVTLPTASSGAGLAAPQLTVTATSATRVRLAWNKVAGAQGYRIYWWNGTKAVLLGKVSSRTTSITISRLKAGSTNQFLVEAYAGTKTGDSAWVSVTLPTRSLTGRTNSRAWPA